MPKKGYFWGVNMSSLVNRKSYEKEDLIKVLIAFKSINGGEHPSKKDWEAGKIKPSIRTFQRVFESLNDAFEEVDKYKSVGDYENHLMDKEQELVLKKYRRKIKKDNSDHEKDKEEYPVSKKRESTTIEKLDYSRNSDRKYRCYQCGQYKNDWEMTIGCISPFRHEDICEDCYSK